MRVIQRFRVSERILCAYFLYVAVFAIFFSLPVVNAVEACLVLGAVGALFAILSSHPAFSVARDWVPLPLILCAYREMDWFSVRYKPRHLEQLWLNWDHQYLYDLGFRTWIESAGPTLPGLLEFCYLLVYGIGTFAVAAFYIGHRRFRADQFFIVYLVGILGAYALFPYFPSDPPRVVFPWADVPRYLPATRRLNLYLVGGYGIHSSVFPSAHVSSAFSAAWGMLRFLPEYRWAGWTMLVYAVLVSIATVYGRYHYGADALAGFVISLIALGVARRLPVEASR